MSNTEDNVAIGGNLTVDGTATLTGAQTFTGDATFAGALNVTGVINADKASGTGLAVDQNATVGGTLSVTGVINADKATGTGLAVDSDATVGGTITVTGAANFTDVINANKSSGTGLAVDNDATIGGTLGVTGTTTAAAVNGTAITASGVLKSTDATGKIAKLFIPWQWFIHSQTTGAATTLVGGGVGAPVSSPELESSGLGGIALDAQDDVIACFLPVPYDMDVTASVAFEAFLHFASASESGDSVTLNLLWRQFTANTTALALGNTAADTQFSARAWAVDSAVHVATGAVVNANQWVIGRTVTLAIKAATVTAFSSAEINFLGLEMAYTKRFA